MSIGALSVALLERPTVPKTLSTSGNVRMIWSCFCSRSAAEVIEIPGSAVGMYSVEPSYSGGMNWLPIRKASGSVSAQKNQVGRDSDPSMAQAPADDRQIQPPGRSA